MFRALFMSVILITVIALDTAKASMDIGNPNIQQASVKSEKKIVKTTSLILTYSKTAVQDKIIAACLF